jgi:hypothetical protein
MGYPEANPAISGETRARAERETSIQPERASFA